MFLLNCTSAFSLEIVYPKTNPVTINATSTFFIGSTNPTDTLKINDIEVKLSPSGAFAQVVPLCVGKNNFEIMSYPSQSCPCCQGKTEANVGINFSITRPEPNVSQVKPSTLLEYPQMNNFYVVKDNAPLRMAPVDSGINRLSHLPKGVRLIVNGEKGNFYRVYLNSQLSGWILKSDVEPDVEQKNCDNMTLKQINLKKYKLKEEKEFSLYEFDLDEKIPFILKENEKGLTLQLFNVNGQPDNTFCLNISAKKLFGYDTYYVKNKFVLKVRKINNICANKPLKGIKIAVDAGHGGKEFGAIGGFGDKEKDINLLITKKLQQELIKRGATVIMTRESDVDVSLSDRVKIAKHKDATLLISIHANALPDGADPLKNRGTSVYYYHNQAKPLAECILKSMTEELCTQNDKVRQGSLALVRSTSSVSVLIEVAYIINPDDYACLLDTDFQTNCAKAIADGIENYIKN